MTGARDRHMNATLMLVLVRLKALFFEVCADHAVAACEACGEGYMDATALAEHLVKLGIPFRKAHHAAGKLVNLAMKKGVKLVDLDSDELQSVHALLDEEVHAALGGKGVTEGYKSEGSANPRLVLDAIEEWRKRLKGEGDH